MSVNDYMDAKVPDFLTEEKAKEIRDEINAFRETLIGQGDKEEDVLSDNFDNQNKYIKVWALEKVLKKWNITEEQLKKVIYTAQPTEYTATVQDDYSDVFDT